MLQMGVDGGPAEPRVHGEMTPEADRRAIRHLTGQHRQHAFDASHRGQAGNLNWRTGTVKHRPLRAFMT